MAKKKRIGKEWNKSPNRPPVASFVPKDGLPCGNCQENTLNYDHKLRLYVCSECHTKENR